MPLTPQGEFSFKHTNQADTPNVATATLKGQWDTQANELKATINNLIIELEKDTATSGAEQIGSLLIANIDGTTIHAQLLSLRDKLKSVIDGSSGADFINATAITGLTGGTVQALLEALKNYADSVGVALTDVLTTHKTSSDHDGRYFTETELNNGQLDSRYYTETELNAGQLDNRYFTETELQATVDGTAGADKIGATQVSPGSGTTVQAIVEWLYLQITNTVIGQIPDGSITPAKLSFDPATQVELDAHTSDNVKHITAGERTTWNGKADNAALTAHLADYSLQIPYAAVAGVVNVYTAALAPALTAYVAGVALAVNINITNTGAATINVNGLGAKAILDSKGNAMTAGKLRATSIYTLRYNGTAFILQGEGGGGGTALAADILAPKTATVDSGDIVGTMVDRAGDTAALASVVSGTTLKLRPSEGYRDGINDFVTITDADWTAPNLPNGLDIFGLVGTGGNVKRWATGTLTTAGITFSITGLAFNPTKVMYWQTASGGTVSSLVGVATNPADIFNATLHQNGVGYIESGTQKFSAGGSSFGTGQVVGIFCGASGSPIRWYAFE